MKSGFILPACLAFLLFCHCSKEADPVLPAITTEGKNTIGFTVDEKVWLPYYECSYMNSGCKEISITYMPPRRFPGYLKFGFTREKGSKYSSLDIYTPIDGSISTAGNMIDSVSVLFNSGESSGGPTGLDGRYAYPQSGSKFLITRLDTVNQIISGEFEFILKEQNWSGKTIYLREGRFDFKYPFCSCR